jgi:hypothetical protein
MSEADNLEVHHIRERNMADSEGHLDDGSSVHAAANLIVLCDDCHLQCHNGLVEARPQIQTSDGPEESVCSPTTLSIGSPPTSVGSHKQSKWSEDELMTIESVRKRFPKLSLKGLSDYLLNTHQISISSASLRKFTD